MEERKLSWGDRLLNPIVKRTPLWIKPNHLSFARMPVALFVAVLLRVGSHFLGILFIAFAVFLDALDGALARWRGEQTKLGEWLDPCADKVMVVGILLTNGRGHFPFELIIVTASIEVILALGRLLASLLGKSGKANAFGKIKMWLQSTAVIGLVAGVDWTLDVANITLWAALVFAVLSVVFHARDIFARSQPAAG